jgi:ribose 5-phosphate isomerase B
MKIAVAADHAGYELKNHLRGVIEKLGHTVTDLGAHNAEPSDYPDFAEAIGKAVQSGAVERGVLICGSGVGASIAANKLHGIRAAICHDAYSAHQGVEHDNMNILVLGSRVIGPALAEDLVEAFLKANFTNEARHVRRLEKVNRLESKG